MAINDDSGLDGRGAMTLIILSAAAGALATVIYHQIKADPVTAGAGDASPREWLSGVTRKLQQQRDKIIESVEKR